MKGAGVEVKQSLRLARHPACKGAGWASDLGAACVGRQGKLSEDWGFLKKSEVSLEKVALPLSVTPLPQFLICKVEESHLLRCLCGSMETALDISQPFPSLSLAGEAFQSR